MKIQLALASAMVAGAMAAFAGRGPIDPPAFPTDDARAENDFMRDHDELSDLAAQCPELTLSQAQRDQLRTLREETRTAALAQKETLRQAKAAFVASLTAANATDEIQRARAQDVRQAATRLVNLAIDAHERAFFDVIKLDQRGTAHACMLRAKQEMKRRYLQRECAALPH